MIERVAAIAAEGGLAPTAEMAADLIWASANAASLLYVTVQLHKAPPPTSAVLEDIREHAMQAILSSEPKGNS